MALLVADSQLTDEAFVEDLASLLSSGEVHRRGVPALPVCADASAHQPQQQLLRLA